MADQEEVRGATSLASATEHLWRIYQVINEWIRFADAKSGALLAACGAIITIEVTVMSDHQDYLKAHHLIFVLAVAAVVGLIVSSVCCLECIRPRQGDHGSLIFFEQQREKGDSGKRGTGKRGI